MKITRKQRIVFRIKKAWVSWGSAFFFVFITMGGLSAFYATGYSEGKKAARHEDLAEYKGSWRISVSGTSASVPWVGKSVAEQRADNPVEVEAYDIRNIDGSPLFEVGRRRSLGKKWYYSGKFDDHHGTTIDFGGPLARNLWDLAQMVQSTSVEP